MQQKLILIWWGFYVLIQTASVAATNNVYFLFCRNVKTYLD